MTSASLSQSGAEGHQSHQLVPRLSTRNQLSGSAEDGGRLLIASAEVAVRRRLLSLLTSSHPSSLTFPLKERERESESLCVRRGQKLDVKTGRPVR